MKPIQRPGGPAAAQGILLSDAWPCFSVYPMPVFSCCSPGHAPETPWSKVQEVSTLASRTQRGRGARWFGSWVGRQNAGKWVPTWEGR
jgi:hypothetical protein